MKMFAGPSGSTGFTAHSLSLWLEFTCDKDKQRYLDKIHKIVFIRLFFSNLVYRNICFSTIRYFITCVVKMPSITDMLNLNKLDMFQTMRKVLETDGANIVRNLIAYKDQILYIWNPDECCLYSLLLNTVHEEQPLYQVRNQY
jgi:hypothetical protein